MGRFHPVTKGGFLGARGDRLVCGDESRQRSGMSRLIADLGSQRKPSIGARRHQFELLHRGPRRPSPEARLLRYLAVRVNAGLGSTTNAWDTMNAKARALTAARRTHLPALPRTK